MAVHRTEENVGRVGVLASRQSNCLNVRFKAARELRRRTQRDETNGNFERGLIVLPKTLLRSHASNFGRMGAVRSVSVQTERRQYAAHLLVTDNAVDGKLHLQTKRFARDLLRLAIVLSTFQRMHDWMHQRILRALRSEQAVTFSKTRRLRPERTMHSFWREI
jgi:hypothetical protein